MPFLYGPSTATDLVYSNITPGTALASFTSEALANDTTGMGSPQVSIPPYWLLTGSLYILAHGILSSTGTPNYTFTIRLGASGQTAPIVLGSGALTTGSGVSNKLWKAQGIVALQVAGAPGGNSTVRGTGTIDSPGLASAISPLWGGAASPGTIATVDVSITNFISVNIACSASSSSNTITLLGLTVIGLH